MWDVRAGARNPVQVLQGHSRSVWSLKMAPSSLGGDDALLSAGNCGNINLWDLRAGKVEVFFPLFLLFAVGLIDCFIGRLA